MHGNPALSPVEEEAKSVPDLWSKGHKMVAGNAKEDRQMYEAAVL